MVVVGVMGDWRSLESSDQAKEVEAGELDGL